MPTSRFCLLFLVAGCLAATARLAGAAQITVGTEFIYPTEYSQPNVGANVVSPSIPSGFKTRQLGSSLYVVPIVGNAGATQLAAAGTAAHDQQGNTPLMLAAAAGDLKTTQQLLAQGADVNAVNLAGATALMGAAAGGYTEVARALLAKGAAVNETTRTGQTALMFAARNGHARMVDLLLKCKADPRTKDGNGKDALAWAESSKQPATASLLRPKPAK